MSKPQRFEIGQAVTPKPNTSESFWHTVQGNPSCNVKPGEIYHVLCYESDIWVNGKWYIGIEELDHNVGFEEDGFDPVISDKELATELIEIELEVTV